MGGEKKKKAIKKRKVHGFLTSILTIGEDPRGMGRGSRGCVLKERGIGQAFSGREIR